MDGSLCECSATRSGHCAHQKYLLHQCVNFQPNLLWMLLVQSPGAPRSFRCLLPLAQTERSLGSANGGFSRGGFGRCLFHRGERLMQVAD
jgi:hypothetical protein